MAPAPMGKVQEENEQEEEAGIWGGDGLDGPGLQRSRGLRHPNGRALSTARLETAL